MLVQRGFDNVYVLTGGLVDYADLYPDHIEGIALPKKPVDPSKKASRDVYKTAPSLSTTGPKSVKSVATTRRKDSSDVSSVMSTLSVAETIISKANVRKERVAGGGANYR